mmetsp:Transcript_5855/g.11702  ORF Transcript_5855/g.11702 Transcript_5855/m.11702 type:complete len:228 (-) Transcript_5855:243-926(-)
MHGFQSLFPILDHPRPLELVFRVFHFNPAAMKAHTSQCLQGNINKPLVIDRSSKFNVPEVSRVGFVMEISEARVVHSSVDWLTGHVGLISSNPRGDFSPIDSNSLRHRILPQFVRIDDPELQFLDATKTSRRVPEVGGGLGEGDGPGFPGRAVFLGSHDFLLFVCEFCAILRCFSVFVTCMTKRLDSVPDQFPQIATRPQGEKCLRCKLMRKTQSMSSNLALEMLFF